MAKRKRRSKNDPYPMQIIGPRSLLVDGLNALTATFHAEHEFAVSLGLAEDRPSAALAVDLAIEEAWRHRDREQLRMSLAEYPTDKPSVRRCVLLSPESWAVLQRLSKHISKRKWYQWSHRRSINHAAAVAIHYAIWRRRVIAPLGRLKTAIVKVGTAPAARAPKDLETVIVEDGRRTEW
jgi:hypothetical protein